MNDSYIEKSKRFKVFHSSEIGHEKMSRLQERLIEMLRIVAPILERNGIRYSLCGGTLLGAAINGKILPWDVDIDICIFDEDYERALRSLQFSIPDWMMIQWTNTEKNYYHGWAKVRDKFSKVSPNSKIYENNGIWIDLYKLSHVKKSEKEYLVLKEHLDYLERRCAVGDISKEEMEKRIMANDLYNKIEIERNRASANQASANGYIVWSIPIIYIDESCCFPLKRIRFEEVETYSFYDYDNYLKNHYGEHYKELPPVEQRKIGINDVMFL